MAFTKLDGGIIDSSIWAQPLATRVVWVTILAKCGPDHIVHCSRSGLQRAANVDPDLFDEAIRILENPDPESRTKDHEGRRIVPVEGGWFVINHEKYRIFSYSESEEAIRKRKYRERISGQNGTRPGTSQSDPGHSASASASDSYSLNEREEEEEREDQEGEEAPKKAKKKPPTLEELSDLEAKGNDISIFPAYRRIRLDRTAKAENGTLGKWRFILQQDLDGWAEAFPSVNIREELLKAKAWLLADPSRIYKNYAEFLRRWFSRTMDRGGSRRTFFPRAGQEAASSDWAARKEAELKKGGKG